MKTTSIRHLSFLTLLCCAASSCVVHTQYKDEPREKVRFSSASAAQTFYDAYASVGSPNGNGNVTATLPLPVPYWKKTQDTENTRFNAAIRIADTDHNGVISEKESRGYAAKIQDSRKTLWEGKVNP